MGADPSVGGEWDVSFTTPNGPVEYTMYITQDGTRLAGRLTSDAGEFPLRGTVEGQEVKIRWTLPDAGQLLDVLFTAKVEGERMTGTARLGNRGEGTLTAERVGQ